MFYKQFMRNHSIFSAAWLSLTVLLCYTLSGNLLANEAKTESFTKVYKVIGDDGSVSFSDQPNAQSETLLVPPIITIPAIDPDTVRSAPQILSPRTELDSYSSLSILAPANDSAFYSASGDVDVIVDVKPALLREDKLEFYLDNKLVQTDRQLQVRLPLVDRGTHTLKVKLLSSDGNTLKESQSTFTVHKPSIRN